MNIKNELKYNFTDFTTAHYAEILKEAKKNYTFSFFNDFDKDSKFLLLRHDIDFSPQRALRCAQIESDLEARSTFFLHLHSEFYNVFESKTFKNIKKIIELGHCIGIHFDIHFYDIKTTDEINKKLEYEKSILEKLFNIEIKVFSFHNTNSFIMNCKDWTYGGMINTYAEYFQKNVKYCSDSNGYWQFERMIDVITQGHNSLQLLTHCEWWTEEVMSPWDKIKRAIDGRANYSRDYYINLLKENKKNNIDWN